jgi:hypothetical protein
MRRRFFTFRSSMCRGIWNIHRAPRAQYVPRVARFCTALRGRTIDAVTDRLFVVEYSGIYFLDPDTGALRLVHAKGLTEAERAAELRKGSHLRKRARDCAIDCVAAQ